MTFVQTDIAKQYLIPLGFMAVATMLMTGCYQQERQEQERYVPNVKAVEEHRAALDAIKNKEFEKALEHANNAVEVDPEYTDARITRVRLLIRNDKVNVAKSELDIIVVQEPDNALAHLVLGLVLEATGDRDGAQKQYEQAMRLYEEQKDAFSSPDRWMERAVAAFMARGKSEGIKAINDVLEQYPQHSRTLFVKERMMKADRSYFLNWI